MYITFMPLKKEFECDAAEKGIILHEDVATALKALASRFEVAVPAELKKLDVHKAKPSMFE